MACYISLFVEVFVCLFVSMLCHLFVSVFVHYLLFEQVAAVRLSFVCPSLIEFLIISSLLFHVVC